MKPYASVIIASYYSSSTIISTLDSLKNQTSQEFETIVVNSSQETQTGGLVQSRYPWVIFHQHPHRLLVHAARNQGVRIAQGRLFLFTDPDLILPPDWIEHMIASHRAGHPILVGEMDCVQTNWMALGVHLTKFHFLLPNTKRRHFTIAPTANAGYDRELFERIGEFPGTRFCGDALQSWKAIQSGESIFYVRGISVIHRHDHTISCLAQERRQRGHEFMQERMGLERWKRWRIYAHILIAPLLPIYVLLIAARDAAGAGWFLRYLRTLPVQLIGQVCWCFGELQAQIQAVQGRK